MARVRPEPYDADRHRWILPDWVYRVGLPRGAQGWFVVFLGVLVAVAVAAAAWRFAVAYWYVALPVLGAVWWLADRWWRRRWEMEKQRRERLTELWFSIEMLDEMSWLDFEYAVRDLMRRDGVAAEHVGKPGDFSGDVVGHDAVLDGTWMVQAKHYGPKTKVKSEDVQKVAGAAKPVYHADLTLVVTTNTYTKPARTFAAMSGTHLIDREALVDWAGRGVHLHDVLGLTGEVRRSAS